MYCLFFYFWPCLSAKLSYFRDLKLGVNIAARGESRDLLNADGERNDYDWYAHLIAHVSLFCSMLNTHVTLFSFNKYSIFWKFKISMITIVCGAM